MPTPLPTSYGSFEQKDFSTLKASGDGTMLYDVELDNGGYYEQAVSMEDIAFGANMYLSFDPNDRVVDARKIGFVQVARGFTDGKPANEERWRKPVMVKEGDAKDSFIDQDKGNKNPLYATGTDLEMSSDKSTHPDKLEGYKDASTPLNPEGVSDYSLLTSEKDKAKYSNKGILKNRKWYGAGAFGFRYADAVSPESVNGFVKKPATFQDAPHIADFYSSASQEFETTVLVAEGSQKGLYLGSVKWGWERNLDETTLDTEVKSLIASSVDELKKIKEAEGGDKKAQRAAVNLKLEKDVETAVKKAANDAFGLKPLTVESAGAPSENFFAAAKQWNKPDKGRADEDTVDLPLGLVSLKADKVQLYANKEEIGSANIKEISNSGQWRFLESADVSGTEYVSIRCVEGDNKGTSGWVKRSDVNLGELENAVK